MAETVTGAYLLIQVLGNKLNFQPDSPLKEAEELGPMPYVVVGDDAFPLHTNLMRPYPGRGCPPDQQAFNYRLSFARRIVENAFGILAAQWRVFHTKLSVRPELVTKIVKAACCLHNMLQAKTTPAEVTNLLQDSQRHPEGILNMQAIMQAKMQKGWDTCTKFFLWSTPHWCGRRNISTGAALHIDWLTWSCFLQFE